MVTIRDDYDSSLVDYITKLIFNYYDVSLLYMKTKNKKGKIPTARHMCWYILHYHFDFSFALIAKIYNMKSRGVRQGIADMKFFTENLEPYMSDYENIVQKIEW